jgi:DNA-binding transcriptional LysR family regulator
MANDNFDYAQLVAFEKAAETGNFTTAAAVLGLSQPALSHRIRLLEEAVGRRLFDRRHRGVALTPDGEVFYEAVHASLARIRAVVEGFRQADAHRRIRLSMDFAFGALWLMPRLADLGEALDAIDLQINSGHLSPERHLRDSDIAFVLAFPEDLPAGAVRLFGEVAEPVCSPAFLAAHPEARDPERLLGLPLIHNEPPAAGAWLGWRDWAAACAIDWQPTGAQSWFSTYQIVLQAALAGRGLALGWRGLVDDLVASGQLVAPTVRPVATRRAYHAVLPSPDPAPETVGLMRAIAAMAANSVAPGK